MEKATLNFSELTDTQIVIAASQLAAATCASLPRLEDEQAALERAQQMFAFHCVSLQQYRSRGSVMMSAGMDLS